MASRDSYWGGWGGGWVGLTWHNKFVRDICKSILASSFASSPVSRLLCSRTPVIICTWNHTWRPAVALTQISAYSTHKNLAVRKILWSMGTVYVEKSENKQTKKHDANDHGTYASMWKDSAHRLRWTFYFGESERCFWNAFLYFFSSVRISEFLFADFSSTCVRCTHPLKS